MAIETSCDDTCAAVLRGDGTILSNVVSSQGIHAEYEGVVPELASREHLALFLPVLRQALREADSELSDLRAIAVTRGPGLIGCLLVGLAAAKGLAYGLGVPLVGVNHIEGHLRAIEGVTRIEPPFVALVASGGHTEILFVESWGRYELLGATRDDAAGEAFDKVAKLLGLGFPGGPVVDRLAAQGDATAFAFPRAWMGLESGGLDVSFSGLKTAVKHAVERHGMPTEDEARNRFVRDVCASFQAAAVEVLVAKLEVAMKQTGADRVLLSGGVACNSALRAGTAALANRVGGTAYWPTPRLCSDNAAMIGLAALPRLILGERDSLDLAAVANLDDLPFGETRV
ncbi:MAG: tRNA (adenosine(37)-N6)-threonylcarbamoyltransferase complex transferase subunit TsaD [Candidatus Eisenbacteria bacterium]|nr:tRNA (adenosine(37)-N6)-threonylcarbamoyltransferase complex transferase subunit TsaD [Candidatus Eisenbacteria bacterium]